MQELKFILLKWKKVNGTELLYEDYKMKRPRTNTKYTATSEQLTFLQKLITENFKLSKRESYVVKYVLKHGEYHDNHQYHLNNVGKRYKKQISEL